MSPSIMGHGSPSACAVTVARLLPSTDANESGATPTFGLAAETTTAMGSAAHAAIPKNVSKIAILHIKSRSPLLAYLWDPIAQGNGTQPRPEVSDAEHRSLPSG